jgi:hypothetical protein
VGLQESIVQRSGYEVSIIVSDAKRNDAHDCFDRAKDRYVLPEALAASGIKPPRLADRRKDGTGEPALFKYAK